MNELLQMLGLSLLGGVLGLVGGLFLLYQKNLSSLLEKNAIPYAAGVLITVALLGLLPEAIEHVGDAGYWIIFASFLGAYFFEKMFLSIHHHGGDHHHHSASTSNAAVWFVLLGDTIHNFIDGVAIGASFLINPALGTLTAFSTFLHEVPHEIGDFGVLLKAGWQKKNIVLVNLLSALVTVIGTFSALLFAENETLLGSLMAISAGVFLYLGTIDFLPHALSEKNNKRAGLLPLILGIGTMLISLYLSPHTH
jgi:zinc and cadmium transporter